jgi:hypothetical protein
MLNSIPFKRLEAHGITIIDSHEVINANDYFEWLPNIFIRIEPGSCLISSSLEAQGVKLVDGTFTPTNPRRLARKTKPAEWE